MPDQPADIQQRIADAIRDEYAEVVFGETNDEAWLRIAGAVVSELGLIEEREHRQPYGYGDEQDVRYVTEWKRL